MKKATRTNLATVTAVHGVVLAEYVQAAYPAVLPLLAQGWTLTAAMDHTQGVCDRTVCQGGR